MNENELQELFASLNTQLPSERFATDVVSRINRQRRIRVIVLGAAIAIGLTVALVPFAELLIESVRTLIAIMLQIGGRTSFGGYFPGLVSFLFAGISLGLITILERWRQV
jgi:hypothetical protein